MSTLLSRPVPGRRFPSSAPCVSRLRLALLFGLAVLAAGTPALAQGLTVDTAALPVDTGTGVQTLELDAGPGRALQPYLLVGSLSGAAPGTVVAGSVVPLNLDAYTDLTLFAPAPFLTNSFGTLDAAGRATASFAFPLALPGFAGVRFDHAFLTVDPGTGTIDFVSNPVPAVLADRVLTIEALVDGSTIGTPFVDVAGSVGSTLSGAAGLSVTVNGQPASIEIAAGPDGTDRYVARSVQLPPGATQVEVVATAGGTDVFERRTIDLNVTTLPADNVALDGQGRAFLARGSAGLTVLDLSSRQFTTVSLPPLVSSVDDVAVDGGLVFVLDATGTDTLTVLDASDPSTVLSGPVVVSLSLFSGVSAAGGRVLVSGGTSVVSVRSYTPGGVLTGGVSTIDLGIGQPDVVMRRDGLGAFVSTDFAGSVGGAGFGITALDLLPNPTIRSRTGLIGAGFTSGLQGPANFPIVSAEVSGGGDVFYVAAHGGGLTLARFGSGGAVDVLASALLGGPVNHVASPVGPTPGQTVFAVGQSPNRIVEASANPGSGQLALVGTTTLPGFAGGLVAVDADADHVVAVSPSGS